MGRTERLAPALVLLGQVMLGGCSERRTAGDREERPIASPEPPLRAPIDSLLTQSSDGVIAFNSTADSGIVLMDPTTGKQAFLTRGSSPEWSADGRQLAFMREGRIHVIAANGTNDRIIPTEPFYFEAAYMVRPVLSPRGDRLAYSREGEIEVTTLQGGTPHFLTQPSPADDQMPVWSRQGGQLALVRDRDICVVGADGSGLRNLTSDGADNLDPEWSPAGDRIAFSSRRSGQQRIWTIRVDGSDPRMVTRDAADPEHQEYHPSWSPDGTQIVFERWGGRQARDQADLYIARVNNGTTRPLAVTPGFDGLPSWGAFHRSK